MAIIINDNYSLQAVNKAFDARYLNINTPWTSCAAAIAGIPTYRYPGLTININNSEWWWKDGIGDSDLVPKTLGGTSNLSGATNGLQLLCSNTYIGLGGELTQDTTICGSYNLNLGDSSSGLTAISGVTPIFNIQDSDGNSNINFIHDENTPHFDVCLYADNANSNADITLDVDINNGCFIAGTAPNTICCSSMSLLTTDNNEAIYNVHSSNNVMHYIKETCIASSKLSCEALISRSTASDNIKTIMDYDTRSHSFIKDDLVILSILSGGTARYGSNVTLNNDCDLAHKWYVDNATGSIDANNGLSREGDNIVLGGALTGNTCINGDGGVYGLTFSGGSYYDVNLSAGGYINLLAESQVCLGGCNISGYFGGGSFDLFDNTDTKQIQLGVNGDVRFCNLSSRTIQDKILYINENDGRLYSGSSIGINSANNGLSDDGINITLGGDLTGDTIINGLSTHNMCFNNINNLSTNNTNNISFISSSATTCATSEMLVRTPDFTLHNGVNDVIKISPSCNILTDTTNNEGFVYAGDYSTNGASNPRWIPDNAYVTGLTTGSVSTASNGLTLTANDVVLGGTLCENTDICLGGGTPYTLNIKNSGITTCAVTQFSSTAINLCTTNVNSPFQTSRVSTDINNTIISSGFGNCHSCIDLSNSVMNINICGGVSNASITVTDDSSTPRGIEYAADYSSTFSNCSLITKVYVDNCDALILSSGKTYTDNCVAETITGATNGLTKVGQNVCLGGSLIQGTDIYGDGNNFQLGTSTRRINNLTFNSSGSTIINSGTNSVAIGQADMIITDSINSKGLEYADSYENNFTTCSLVSKKYVDDKANVVNVCQISTAYTTLRNDELIAVSGISSNEIFLYATPVIGQRLTVVDICGNAFVEPIVVNGNGHNINDGICSTINTDYGSVTYVFNGIFWSAVAFIN